MQPCQIGVLSGWSPEARVLCSRLPPWTIGLIATGAIPLALFLWSMANRTLRMSQEHSRNKDGWGFLSAINCHLLLAGPVLFGIWALYKESADTLLDLFARGVFPKDGFSTVQNGQYVSGGLTVFAFLSASILAVGAFKYPRRHGPHFTSWLMYQGRPRLVSYYFHLVLFVGEIGLMFNWFLQNICSWVVIDVLLQRGQLNPLDPDGVLGLDRVASLASTSFVVMGAIGLVVAIWLVGARVTLRRELFAANRAHAATALITTVCFVTMAGVELLPFHQVVIEARRVAARELGDEILKTAAALKSATSREKSAIPVSEIVARLDAQQRLYDRVQAIRTWPFNLGVIPLALLTPLVVPIVDDIARQLLALYRRWRYR